MILHLSYPGVANLELHIKNVASLDGGVSDTLESYMLTSHCNSAPSPQHCTSYIKNTSTLVTESMASVVTIA